ncbi:MAG: cation:proton antiporter [Dysgonomonas mossii]|uniref:cation:proton antiporter n=2 Tax=Dysgonomonas mossii TaxID=163665 RepID=UPI001DBB40B4|nr:cation:proton antiporter [Dysgonomonas mossii]MBS5798086.1 cation:proton antiporter [Dysgonomonas mossii]MBS7112588.1 cation:proton antiporter [Dysgonomonas mossii]
MKRLKNTLFYLIIIGAFSGLIYWIISIGTHMEAGRGIISIVKEGNPFQEFLKSITENLHHSIALLILQIIVIIIAARFFGWIFKKIGQPSVIGEILAGIVLGPSLIGSYFPEMSAFLFPANSLGNLQILSQIGLILFMFIIGMELNLKALQSKAHDAIVISHASIIIPFSLGVGLAYFIYEGHAPEHIDFTAFALFMGISLSITAFPVLARIIQERGIHKTKLGAIVITCAAADDITAWCLLAAVIAIVKAGSVVSALYTILFALIYVIFMIKLVRPFLRKIGDLYQTQKQVNQSVVAIFFIVLLASAFITETIGIHALFGAFMAGAIMPDNINFRKIFIGKIEDVALVLFLPIFFVISGLRTEIGLINDPALWEITGLIILLAIIGKFVGSAIAAKVVGQNWKDSLTIGALMNTRGLMELVALNIGYELGVLKAEVFAMMVIMALVTTFMAGPILKLINKIFKDKKDVIFDTTLNITKHKFLLFFRKPERGIGLVKLADSLSKNADEQTSLTAVHIISSTGLQQMDADAYEQESFSPVISKANSLNRSIISLFKISKDVNSDLIDVANKGEYDLLLMNIEESIFEGTLLGRALGFTTQIINPEKLINTVTGKEKLIESSLIDNNTRFILSKAKIPVGIFVDKEFDTADNVFVLIMNQNDEFLIDYTQRLIHNTDSQVSVLDMSAKNDHNVRERIRLIEQNAPNHIRSVSMDSVDGSFLDKQDLIIVSLENFEGFIQTRKDWINKMKSILIITK